MSLEPTQEELLTVFAPFEVTVSAIAGPTPDAPGIWIAHACLGKWTVTTRATSRERALQHLQRILDKWLTQIPLATGGRV